MFDNYEKLWYSIFTHKKQLLRNRSAAYI